MPNWCSTALVVEGNKKDLDKFKNTLSVNASEPVFQFSQIFPMPKDLSTILTGFTHIDGKRVKCWRNIDGKQVCVSDMELKELKKKYGNSNWYDWAIDNWGTKWDVCDSKIITETKTKIQINFRTAWSPPTAWADKASCMFPDLSFKLAYSECVASFYGSTTFMNGNTQNVEKFECEWDEDEDPDSDDEDKPSTEWQKYMDKYSLNMGG